MNEETTNPHEAVLPSDRSRLGRVARWSSRVTLAGAGLELVCIVLFLTTHGWDRLIPTMIWLFGVHAICIAGFILGLIALRGNDYAKSKAISAVMINPILIGLPWLWVYVMAR